MYLKNRWEKIMAMDVIYSHIFFSEQHLAVIAAEEKPINEPGLSVSRSEKKEENGSLSDSPYTRGWGINGLLSLHV